MAEVLLRRLKQDKIVTNYPYTFFESVSRVVDTAIGGCSGCIYGFMCEAVACAFSEYDADKEITPFMWLKAFEKAATALET